MRYTANFTESLRRLPFVRLAVPFILGIVAEELIFNKTVDVFYFLIVSLVLFFTLFFVRLGKSYTFRWLWGVLIFINLFLLGAGIMKNVNHQSTLPLDRQSFFRAVIIEEPEPDERFTQLVVRINAYRDSSQNWIRADEKIRIYVTSDSISTALKLGDILLLNAKLQENPPPKNPEEFDYAYYLARRGFFATSFIKSSDYQHTGHNNLWFDKAVMDIQTAMFNCIKNSGIDGDNLAVLRALIIGDKQLLSEELISSYSAAGAMHVLAVSGLHVGLVFMVLSFVLRPLNRRRFGKHIAAVLIIAGLFLYAALAAFSPSVCRACIMLVFILIGNTLGRKTNVYNSLAASALFLLCHNPYNIFEVGFQLSYCAVISIVCFQPIMHKAIYIRNKILNYAFELATVAIAAQIGTMGITIFYFHVFPNYFLITNILIIPAVTVIMFTVAATLIFSNIPLIGTLTGKLLDTCVSFANEITIHIEKLPLALTENIYINTFQMFLIIAGIISIAFYFELKKNKALIFLLMCFVAFMGINMQHKIENTNQQQIIIYNTRNSSFISFVAGQSVLNIRDTISANDDFDFNTKNNFIKLGIKQHKNISVETDFSEQNIVKSHHNIIYFNKKTIKIATANDVFRYTKPIHVNYLIINKLSGNNIQQIFDSYSPDTVIIDASVAMWQAKNWMREAENKNINCYYVREKGAFVHKER